MAPFTNIPFAPAELSYLYTSLSLVPPIRPDGRSPTDFRPLLAETDILPTANGSARICFADGTEAIVGVKAEVEKTAPDSNFSTDATFNGDEETDPSIGKGRSEWLEVAIEIPGTRDDDQLPIFLSQMLSEALLADRTLKDRLYINRRFHWRLYIDVLLLSQALSYPLPLLSLTTHLALLSARLPSLVSEKDEDPSSTTTGKHPNPSFHRLTHHQRDPRQHQHTPNQQSLSSSSRSARTSSSTPPERSSQSPTPSSQSQSPKNLPLPRAQVE